MEGQHHLKSGEQRHFASSAAIKATAGTAINSNPYMNRPDALQALEKTIIRATSSNDSFLNSAPASKKRKPKFKYEMVNDSDLTMHKIVKKQSLSGTLIPIPKKNYQFTNQTSTMNSL